MRFRTKIGAILIGLLAVASLAVLDAQAVTTSVFSGFTLTGGGTPYSGLVGTLTTPGVTFGTDTGFNWHPFGLGSFGADITGVLNILSTGSHTYMLGSDDGALLFIDGMLIIDRGGPHPPTFTTDSVSLTAGLHPFEIQFFECCGGPSGVDFVLDPGTVIAPPGAVPEPGTLTLVGLGTLGLLGLGWRRRK